MGNHFSTYTCQQWKAIGASYPIIDDRATELWKTISGGYTPYNLVIDVNGEVHYASTGLNMAEVNSVLDTLLSTQSIDPLSIPSKARLVSSFPNPFNAGIQIDYVIEQAGLAEIQIHDANGRSVRTLLRSHHSEGEHRISWYGRDDRGQPLPSGVYLVNLITDQALDSHKILLLK